MVVPFQTVESQIIGRGVTLDGRQIVVKKNRFNGSIPGLGDTGVTVDIAGNAEFGQLSEGFANEDDARRFLESNSEEEYTAFDRMGQETKRKRIGLGIPSGMLAFTEQRSQRTAGTAPGDANTAFVTAVQDVNNAEAGDADTTAGRAVAESQGRPTGERSASPLGTGTGTAPGGDLRSGNARPESAPASGGGSGGFTGDTD